MQHEGAVQTEQKGEDQLADVRTQVILLASDDLVEKLVAVACIGPSFTD